MFVAHAKFQHCEHSNYFVILQKWVPGLAAEDNRVLDGELLYTEILEFNLFAFAHRLFHDDFFSYVHTFVSSFRLKKLTASTVTSALQLNSMSCARLSQA